jgi:hypothetical protein
MDNWLGILVYLLCLVASAGALLIGIGLMAFRMLANRGIADREERKPLDLPIVLIVIGGSFISFVVCVTSIGTYNQKQLEIVACQTILLTDSYKLEFRERRDGTRSDQLKEIDTETGVTRSPASGFTQLAVIDDYVIGDSSSGGGYWFIVDLRELRSDRNFSTQEEFAEALGELSLPTTPELIPADTYCDVEPCQPCPIQ